MNQRYLQTTYENEEDRQTARTLFIIIWVTLGAYLVVFMSGLYWGDRDLLLTTLLSGIFLTVPFWLLKRGYLLSSGYIFMLMVLGMVTVAATLGQGIHDVAIMAYSGIIIFASLALDQVGFKIYVLLILVSMGWLVFGELSGLFVSEAFEMPGWVDYLIIATLLLIVAVTVDLLTTNMRKSLKLAWQEIAQRQQAEEALQESEQRFRTLIENAPIAITLGKDGKLMYANPVYAHMHGFSNADELIGHPSLERVAPQSRNESLERSRQRAQGLPIEMQYELIGLRLDGTEFPILASVTQVNLEDGLANVGFFQDITERKQAEEDLRRIKEQYENIVNTVPVMLYKYVLHPDGSSNFLYVSPKMCREILELDSEVVLADMNLFWNMVHSEDLGRLHQEDAMANRAGKIFYSEVRITTPSSRIKWVALNSKPNPANPGEPAIWSGFLQDITARKQAEEQLRYQGTHDILTGIYNRTFFEVELARLEHSREVPTSMIVADVDYLKVANDTLGHAAGDELIRNVANILRTVFRESDVLARIGGDEFAVLLPSTDSASMEQMLVRVQERLAKHNAEHPYLPPVQLSLGTATAEKNNLTEAFTLADQRMYADKAAHKAKANPEQSTIDSIAKK
jgi:diguanylate cyclase (GGDEF)-like protein/PAS domain S-box-containing protein